MCSVCPYMHSIYTHCTHCTHGSQAESPLVFQTLVARCHSLTSLSLLETPFLSDASWNAIAGVAKLKSFSTRGEITLHYAALFLPPPHTHTHTLDIRKFNSRVSVALGNYQVSDDGWMSLCMSSRGLRTLHIPDCPKLTNSSLRVIANLKGLQHLDISYCSKFVCSLSLSF